MFKKLWKVFWVSLGVLVSLVIIILFATLRIVDKTPYYQTSYYKSTIQNFDNSLSNIKKSRGEINAGFGVVNISPVLEKSDESNNLLGEFEKIPLAGYGERNKPAAGIHDSIYVKALALKIQNQLVLMISADLLLMPPEVADSLVALLDKEEGIKREQLILGATHSHSSIGGITPKWVGEKFSGEYNPKVISFLVNQFKTAAVLAIKDIQPSRISDVEIDAPTLVRNRLNKENGRLNDKFTSLIIEQLEGRKAVISAFSAHATTLGSDNLLVSGDFPGYWQRKIEAEYADVAIYFGGSLGSHSHKAEGEGFERPRFMGDSLAGFLIKDNQEIIWEDTSSLSFFTIPIETSEMQFRVTRNLHLAPFVTHQIMPIQEVCYLQGLKIGNLIWVAMPFELSGEIAIDIKNPLKLAGYNSMFTSFNGAYLGYITPSKYYNEKTYESFLMGWYGPSMGDYVEELLFKICNGLTGERL